MFCFVSTRLFENSGTAEILRQIKIASCQVRSHWRLLTNVFSLSILISYTGSNAMAGIFGNDTLFSAMSGKVVIDGKPLAGVVVEQKAQGSSGAPAVRTTKTAADGSFWFDEITASKGILGILPSEFVVQQEINITYKGETLKGWRYTKRSRESGSETGGKPFFLICDVSNEADFEGNYYGICRLARN